MKSYIALLMLLALIYLPVHLLVLLHISDVMPNGKGHNYKARYAGRWGVNIYGWFTGDFGGGTTARSLYNTLATPSSTLPLTAINLPGAELHHHSAISIALSASPSNDYLFDIFAINAINTIPILTHPKVVISCSHYRIGLWHWETSYLPPDHMEGLNYYDEIWVPASYIAEAISNSGTGSSRTKITVIPYSYEVLPVLVTPSIRAIARAQLTSIARSMSTPLPHSAATLARWETGTTTLFMMVFDFNSDMERKNVLNTIEIFTNAFPITPAVDVGLLIKCVNSEDQRSDYDSLLSHLLHIQDPRIVLLDGHISRSSLLLLRQACSVYVSLHRSEGWGLNILESIFSGIPVLVSGFGGSEQYMLPLSAVIPETRIPTAKVHLHRNFGPYTTNMTWGEPNTYAATAAMQLMHIYYNYYSNCSVMLRNQAIELLGPQRVNGIIEERLRVIQQCLDVVYGNRNSSESNLTKHTCLSDVLGHRNTSSDLAVCNRKRSIRSYLRPGLFMNEE